MEKNVIPFFLGAILFLGACSKQGFLDQTESSDLNEEVVFSDSAYTMNFLSGIYSEIGFATWPKRFGGGGLDASTDEAEGAGLGTAIFMFFLLTVFSLMLSIARNNLSYAKCFFC